MFLELEKISFSYGIANQKVLDDVSISLQQGEVLSVVGPSGCGKSTLLRIISSILPNDKKNSLSGTIRINSQTPDNYRKTGKMAFMFQEATLMPNLTVRDNIELPLKIKRQNDMQKVNNLIKTVGLENATNYLPKQLSGGMKTRVALARSFVTEPEFLFLDEPFSALDIAWKSKLYIELEKLREQTNTTIIIVTHDVQEALLLSDHIIVLNSFGTIEARKEIASKYSIMERVNNISAYMNSVYEDLMLPIQDAIINGQSKTNEKQNSVPVA
jgi:ABC-type nitrate/sulfonate/bicarbonate transport system ATPase subunit